MTADLQALEELQVRIEASVEHDYSVSVCQDVERQLRAPHKAVYSMAMIGVVQEAQCPRFVNLAANVQSVLSARRVPGQEVSQDLYFDPQSTALPSLVIPASTSPATSILLELYAHAYMDKARFDTLVHSIAEKTGATARCADLKRLTRCCEKIVFKSRDHVRNARRIFDVVRGYVFSLSLSLSLYVYMCACTCVCVYMWVCMLVGRTMVGQGRWQVSMRG